MEWLMGKARGVGRGLISGSSSSPNANSVVTSPQVRSSPPESPSSQPNNNPPSYLKSSFLRQQLSLSIAGNTPVDFPFLVEPEHPLEEDEWIAVHTIGLVENLCSIFDPLYEMCLCRPSNNDSSKSHENSFSNEPAEFILSQSTKPVRQVISLLLSECNDAIQSARIFPVKQGEAFSPSDLREEASRICRKLLLCLVHIYTEHVNHLEDLDLVAHMNTIAKHFFAFTMRFKLLQEEGEDGKILSVLHGFHRKLLETPAPNVVAVSPSVQAEMAPSTNPQSDSNQKFLESKPKELESVLTPSASQVREDVPVI